MKSEYKTFQLYTYKTFLPAIQTTEFRDAAASQSLASSATTSPHLEAMYQRLKREDAAVRSQDRNAIMAESWYLSHSLGAQWDPWNSRRTSMTAALELAAASDSIDSTQSPTTTMAMTPGTWSGHPTSMEYMSIMASVQLQGTSRPMIVTRKQKAV